MKKKDVLVCLRGKCKDENLNAKNGKLEQVDYERGLDSLKEHIFVPNGDRYNFDTVLHGWVADESMAPLVAEEYRSVAAKLETQREFTRDYLGVEGHQSILLERYKHLHKKASLDEYRDIHYNQYFQNLFSYAYSISKTAELGESLGNRYDLAISIRFDCVLLKPIDLDDLDPTQFCVNKVPRPSPVFYGDFIAISTPENIFAMREFYNFMKTEIFNNDHFLEWAEARQSERALYPEGRYEHGIYSNQYIYAYFLDRQGIGFDKIIPAAVTKLVRDFS